MSAQAEACVAVKGENWMFTSDTHSSRSLSQVVVSFRASPNSRMKRSDSNFTTKKIVENISRRGREFSRSAALENHSVPLWDDLLFISSLLFSISLLKPSSTFRFHLRPRLAHMGRKTRNVHIPMWMHWKWGRRREAGTKEKKKCIVNRALNIKSKNFKSFVSSPSNICFSNLQSQIHYARTPQHSILEQHLSHEKRFLWSDPWRNPK